MTMILSASREMSPEIPNRMATSSAFGAVIFLNAALDKMTWIPLCQP